MFAKGQTVIQLMEKFAPKSLAVENDKIGLQLGTLNKEITKVLVALDVTHEVADEAISMGAELIVAHHAIIFRPLANLRTDTPMGSLYEKLIKHDIAVYISHTNLDAAEGGMNDWMASIVGIAEPKPLEELQTEKLYKLVVFVPRTHREQVLSAVLGAGAGHIGEYSHCSFTAEGTGTFLPGQGTNPHLGQPGKLERAEEDRIETIVPERLRSKVVQAMLKAHPYEEAAYDLYALELKGKAYGLGRIGKLETPVTLAELTDIVKRGFDVPAVRVVGDGERIVKKAAVLGGSGSRYIHHAIRQGADVLITGDIDYHTAHDALMAGLSIIDPGHNSEKIMKREVAAVLGRLLAESGSRTAVYASEPNTEPFRFA
ncbi:Nif3-like dinuclear metal center hexameric protein [Saccharibacillus sp. CPCC 101409]|uniref:Nif3-like dinuclear metal center hexameric protein n=1 Tax=Saccharibacillus sp. CPCC 101409 TaxID=3058041 RepID=UPI0026739AD5|nr:Nif3-like dinuclear metal center hexameric protein [Saccharibacillus sp. CPCC 101409]MDO3409184.1 Nif3-like dinuclear metal center hexameric protein [Saccharibacillus sp. CPCC 101409]